MTTPISSYHPAKKIPEGTIYTRVSSWLDASRLRLNLRALGFSPPHFMIPAYEKQAKFVRFSPTSGEFGWSSDSSPYISFAEVPPSIFLTVVKGTVDTPCEHQWIDTGLTKTWCKHCDKDGMLNADTLTWEAV